MKPISPFGLGLMFLLDLTRQKVMGYRKAIKWDYNNLISILYLTSRKSTLQAEIVFRFEICWLNLQPKLAPPKPKSWLRP